MKKYVLREYSEDEELRTEETFDNFEDLKEHLIQNTNDYFGWINDNGDSDDYREVPDFKDVETIQEIESILDAFDYSWWSMAVESMVIIGMNYLNRCN